MDAASEELDRISSHSGLILFSIPHVSASTSGYGYLRRQQQGRPTVLAALVFEGKDSLRLLPDKVTPLLAVLVGLVDLLDYVCKHDVDERLDLVLLGAEKEDEVE